MCVGEIRSEPGRVLPRAVRPVFFADRDSDGDFVQVLREANIPVERHDDHLNRAALIPDEEWISLCAQRSWVGVTHDRRLRYKKLSVDAVMYGGAKVIITIAKNANHRQRGENFVASMEGIRQFLEEHQEPFIAKLYMRPRGIEPWLLHSDWQRGRS